MKKSLVSEEQRRKTQLLMGERMRQARETISLGADRKSIADRKRSGVQHRKPDLRWTTSEDTSN